MRIVFAFVGALGLLCLAPTGALADSFTYNNFSSIAGLDLNGTAAQDANTLRLTATNQPYSSGSFFTTGQFNVSLGFTTSFKFFVGPGTLYQGSPADGFAFVIQDVGSGALGGAGGGPTGMGYGGIPQSLAVEFDTYEFNGESGDPLFDHVGVQSCGVAPNSTDHGTACNKGGPVAATLIGVHTVNLTYLPGSLSVLLDGTTILVSAIDIGSLLALSDGKAYLGFAGSTGLATEDARLLSWSYSSVDPVPEPGTMVTVAAGLLALVYLRRRP